MRSSWLIGGAGLALGIVLGLIPEVYGVVAAAVGVIALARQRHWKPVLLAFLLLAGAFGLVGVINSVWPPMGALLHNEAQTKANLTALDGAAMPAGNLLQPSDIAGLVCWTAADRQVPLQPLSDGFFQATEHETGKHPPCVEILSWSLYPLAANTAYSLTFYYRSPSGPITFSTRGGPPTRSVRLKAGLYRGQATFAPASSAREALLLDLAPTRPGWGSLDVGYPSIVRANQLSGLHINVSPTVGAAISFLALSIFSTLAIFGTMQLRKLLGSTTLLAGLFVGLAVSLVLSLSQLHDAATPRAFALTGGPNFLGSMSALAAVIFASYASAPLALGGAALSVALVAASGTRTALYGLVVAAIILLIRRDTRIWTIAGMLTLGTALLLRPAGLGGVLTRFLPTAAGGEGLISRQQIWAVALDAFKQHPLAGLGFGMFPTYYLAHRPAAALNAYAPHAHNLVLQLLVDGGGILLAAYAAYWVALLSAVRRQLSWMAVSVLVAALAMNFTDATWTSGALLYMLAFGLGMSQPTARTGDVGK